MQLNLTFCWALFTCVNWTKIPFLEYLHLVVGGFSMSRGFYRLPSLSGWGLSGCRQVHTVPTCPFEGLCSLLGMEHWRKVRAGSLLKAKSLDDSGLFSLSINCPSGNEENFRNCLARSTGDTNEPAGLRCGLSSRGLPWQAQRLGSAALSVGHPHGEARALWLLLLRQSCQVPRFWVGKLSLLLIDTLHHKRTSGFLCMCHNSLYQLQLGSTFL